MSNFVPIEYYLPLIYKLIGVVGHFYNIGLGYLLWYWTQVF